MDEKAAVGLIEEVFNEYRKVESSIKSEHEALLRIKKILTALNNNEESGRAVLP